MQLILQDQLDSHRSVKHSISVCSCKRVLLSVAQFWSGRMQRIRWTLKWQRTFSVGHGWGCLLFPFCLGECGEKIWNAAPLVHKLEIKIQLSPQKAFYVKIEILGTSMTADCQSHCFTGNWALLQELLRPKVVSSREGVGKPSKVWPESGRLSLERWTNH